MAKKKPTKEEETLEQTLEIMEHLEKAGGCRPHPNQGMKDCFLSQDEKGNVVMYDFREPGVLSVKTKTTAEEKKDGAGPWKELNSSPVGDVKITAKGIELNAKQKPATPSE